MRKIIVTAWSNGGSSYGFRLYKEDRDEFFPRIYRKWDRVLIKIRNFGVADANINKETNNSFWGRCPQLRSSIIGHWLENTGQSPWEYRGPPQFELIHVRDNMFRLGKQVRQNK